MGGFAVVGGSAGELFYSAVFCAVQQEAALLVGREVTFAIIWSRLVVMR
jgi:hypothetical protein